VGNLIAQHPRISSSPSTWAKILKQNLYTGTTRLPTIRTVEVLPASAISGRVNDDFRDKVFAPERPYVLKEWPPPRYPAIKSWFSSHGGRDICGLPLHQHSMSCWLDYELTLNANTKASIEEYHAYESIGMSEERLFFQNLLSAIVATKSSHSASEPHGNHDFIRFRAPLGLFLHANAYNVQSGGRPLTDLYIAQNAIADLPRQLQEDLSAPDIVGHITSRGDIYSSSIWLGLEPTYTPLHRDPNHNILVQLCGAKTVRLMDSVSGEEFYRAVRAAAGKAGGNSRMRHEDMMHEPERSLLKGAMWDDDIVHLGHDIERIRNGTEIFEARLDVGDALYIPLGWWHSVQSCHNDGRLNGSANWWFR
jgi:hypothetical protein